MGQKFSVENFKLSKIIKNHFKEFFKNPELFFNKKKRSLKFHFDLFHGKGNLDLAINLLDDIYKEDFKKYMETETSFHPHNSQTDLSSASFYAVTVTGGENQLIIKNKGFKMVSGSSDKIG